MKRRVAAAAIAALVACLAFALCACTEPYDPNASMKEPSVDESALKDPGVLHVGVNADSYPLAGQADQRWYGLEVDIAAAVGQELGLKVEFVDVGDDTVGALAGDEVDMVMGVEADASKGQCWRSAGYAPSCIALFSMKEKAKLPTREKGQVVAVQTSSLAEWLVSRQLGEGSVQSEDDVKAAFQQLADGAVKYAAADAVVGAYVVNKMGIDAYIIGVMQVPDTYCIGIAEDNHKLQKAVKKAMSSIKGNGVFDIILEKWTGGPVDVSNARQTDGAGIA